MPGCWLWDVDGNEYLDMRIGDWVMALGHRNEAVRDAIVAQLEKASQLGAPEWDLSYRMASLLIERMPSVERVRFLASGTETNLLALRLARAHTGRTSSPRLRAATTASRTCSSSATHRSLSPGAAFRPA